MNQFMIGLVLVIIIIILIVLLGTLNKMYPEGFFGTCKYNTKSQCVCPFWNDFQKDTDCTQNCPNCYCQNS